MYKNLLKNVGCSFSKNQLLNVKLTRHQTDSCYHSGENGYFGFRPKVQALREIPKSVLEARQSQSNLYRWIEAFRTHGHRIANINPVDLRKNKEAVPELNHTRYGIPSNQKLANLDGLVYFADKSFNSIEDLKQTLQDSYCSEVSAEFTFIEDEFEREWFAEHYEKMLGQKASFDAASKRDIAELMIRYEAWDHFLAIKFPAVKRYGGEGAESMVSFFRTLFIESTKDDVQHVVLGMPHRGKLNLLVTLFQQRPAKIFRKFKGLPEFDSEAKAMMDIPNHFNASIDLEYDQKKVHLSMLHNPSHLEAVNPVSMGKARSKQQSLREGAFNDDKAKEFGSSVINVILHGDAAIAGQGINQECLMMTNTPNFEIGGTIHMIVNNQVGYTTPSERGKSSRYCSDIGKSINAPVIHVNGDDPELVGLVCKLAFDYQRKFRKDVFIDFNCFRKYGHNELDDPTFTNPSLYKIIHNRKSIPENYVKKLISENIMTQEEADKIKQNQMDYYNHELTNVESYLPEKSYFNKQWTGFVQAPTDITYWDTGLNYELLSYIGGNSVQFPKGFNIHPHLHKMFINGRLKKLEQGQLDWATAESLAFGSLMYQGFNVRISGEDVGRGTFSQRHCMLIDQQTNEIFIPLNQMKGGHGGKLEVANSILSEEAVLGFEYGMSIDNPNNLIIWEAQFGDFYNGAQIIIDTFIASGETKWMTSSGLVMLLPHGYDGMASEHSSCRVERFLQQTDSKESSPDGDDVNMQVINPTTPAQYFHALRRQMIRNFRKPLVVVAPKTLLRLAEATSSHSEFLPGTFFQNVLGDTIANTKSVKKVILCSGKHYYNLHNERISKKIEDVAIIRVESLAPFPIKELQEELAKYKNAKTFLWSQEEHRNFGCWSFIKPRFESMLERRINYVGRYEAGTPAVGVSSLHHKEAAYVVNQSFKI